MKIIYLDIDNDTYNKMIGLNCDTKKNLLANSIDQVEAIIATNTNQKICLVIDVDNDCSAKYEFCAELRSKQIPTIFVTSNYDKENRVRLLSLGATLVIAKPFCCEEIMYAAKALNTSTNQTTFNDKNFDIDLIRHRITFQKNPLTLSPQQYSLLLHLIKNEGKVVSRKNINRVIHEVADNNDTVSERYVDSIIRDIRKLTTSNIIATKRGVGYMYIENYK